MSYFIWRSDYSVGSDIVDSQHRHLLELAELLRQALCAGQVTSVVAEALQALKSYVAEHFSEEEALFDRIGSPGTERHRRLHRQIEAELAELLVDRDLGYRQLENKLIEWVERRLVAHMIHDDRACARGAGR